MKRIAVILAGGQSRRMGGHDKGCARLGRKRLIDHVIERLTPQTDRLIISASHDYGTGLTCVADAPDAPKGPVAGIYSVQQWLSRHESDMAGFFTAPVDGPYLPSDLVDRLADGGGPAMASDGENDHPTFAYWTCGALAAAWPLLLGRPRLSLRDLAAACGACRVVWPDGSVFLNINTPEDLAAARIAREGYSCR